MKLPAKPTAAALACAREIEETEPHHKRSEQRIVEKGQIIDPYLVSAYQDGFKAGRVTPLHEDVNTSDEQKPPLSEAEREAFVRVAINPASD